MRYGSPPYNVGIYYVAECPEMMFYQDMPIKMAGSTDLRYEKRLQHFNHIIMAAGADFIRNFGYGSYGGHYMYLSAKHLFQTPGKPYNRPGYHADGFMTTDINYIWCNNTPTIFNIGEFNLSQDDKLSMMEMEQQAKPENEFTYPVNSLLRLDQYNIHKVADPKEVGMRTFVKVSFSKDKYALLGNSHNYEFEYKWDMKPRSAERNIPQVEIK